ATMLANEVRPYDTVVRTGGEEFLIICPTIDAVGARALAARLRVCTPVRCAEALPDGPRQTVSIGIAVYPEHGATAQQVLDAADDALYAAKDAGRDTYRLAGTPLEVTRSAVSPGVQNGQEGAATAGPGGTHSARPSRGR
ncbi:MAG: two-component system, cell cycle response regulator, partial [Actinoplanes sp.]|nr:two-component system, cell cycle response regulator [Actinoplanes sp.]